MRKCASISLAVMIAGFAGTLWSGQPTVNVGASSNYGVSIVSYHFRPQNINITTGTDVVWTFLTNGTDSSDVHTVTADNQTQAGGGVFQSPLMHPGQTFDFTFYSPGKYPYHCSVHPYMTGLVKVTGPALTPPAADNSILLYLGLGAVAAVALVVAFMIHVRKKHQVGQTQTKTQ